MNISVLGPPGSGKGAQTGRVAKYFNLKHIVVGDIVKQEIRQKTEVGKVMYEHTKDGHFVPNDIVIELLKKQLQDLDNYKGFIIDTAPINLTQKRLMQDVNIDAVISLDIRDYDVVRRRTMLRLICPNCGSVTSKLESPDGICPVCGAKLERRYDDTPETVNKRIEQFERETVPVLQEFKKEGKLINIDAEPDKDSVFHQIIEKLENFFAETTLK